MDPPFRVFTFKMLGKLILELGIYENDKTVLKREDLQAFNEVFLREIFQIFEKNNNFYLKHLILSENSHIGVIVYVFF